MIQHPAILALSIASLLTCLMLIYAAWYGTRILEKWDLHSGSELQLELERRTYLISVILSYILVFQILSLFLYIFTADNLHSQFTGAMCAAGSLGVNSYGYPVLIMKIVNCLLAGVWLIVNHVDTRGYDYPLIKTKYGLLNILAPLILLEAVLQFAYFLNLKADVITSCCGSLFSTDKRSIAGEIAGLPNSLLQTSGLQEQGLGQMLSDRFMAALVAGFRSAVFLPFQEQLERILGLTELRVTFAFDQPISLKVGKYPASRSWISPGP